MEFSTAQLDALFALGPTITVGAESAKCSFRVSEVAVEVEGMTVLELHPNVLVRSDALPSADRHAAADVGGTPYVIRDIQRTSNGQFKRLVLVEVLT
jgi:hypothetical protein